MNIKTLVSCSTST